MAQVYIKYNPYKLITQIKVNGKEISDDSTLFKVVKKKRLQEWIGKFPQMLVDELNTVDFDIEFYGMDLDWDDFEDVFERAKAEGIIKKLDMKFTEAKDDEEISERIVDIFTELQNGPFDDFRDPKLIKAFNNINNSVFPINVIATMSSGKSTLINALLGKKLMPAQQAACTATITEILDNDMGKFTAVAYDKDNVILREVPELTYEIMKELNSDENVNKIAVDGDIPFIDAKSTALKLIDTPGTNNSQNQEHKNTTYRAIGSDSNNMILYILNGEQLSTDDDAELIDYVAGEIKKGGKLVRDRFLFVINKMDAYDPQDESISKVITSAKAYLTNHGIDEPQIFLCSAYTALNIKTQLAGIDIGKVTMEEFDELPVAAQETINKCKMFNKYESMHLEQYATLSPSAQRELDYKLSQAEKNGDKNEQALIHCGICSIEAAITAYVKKYAKTKKVKDLVETFNDVIVSTQVLTKVKDQVLTDEGVAKECAQRAVVVKEKIANGKEAEEFKARIAELNPMDKIRQRAEALQADVSRRTSRVFESYGDVITSRTEAKRLVNQFATMSSDAIAELTVGLENVINQEVIETGEKILEEYQEKLQKIDESADSKKLDFNTIDIIKGALNNIKEHADSWRSDDFAEEITEDVGETTYEERVIYDKVGQREEQVFDGNEEVKIGTKKVKVGSHKEWAGTRTVKNPDKKWWKIFTPKYIEEDVYETVDDYEDKDVYETVAKYKTVIKDIYEPRTERIEKFSVETSVIQSGLVRKLREALDDGIKNALVGAEEEVAEMKEQFSDIFDELDNLIQKKYTELEDIATNQKLKEAELEKNKKLLEWLEAIKAEIDEVINM
jgi:GTPase SAR1 family protein